MATIEKFEDVEAWKEARVLANHVFEFTQRDNFKRDFSLVNQINAAAGSVMDNIAEGFERDGKKEFVQFLSISKGSIGEVRSQLYRAKDRHYINDIEFQNLIETCLKISRMIKGLITYLKNSELKGTKYK